MPNIGVVLKDEITRLAKKVLKSQVAPLQANSAAHRRHIAAMKRQISALEKEVARLRKGVRPAPAAAAGGSEEDSTQPLRFQAKGLRSLRARFGVSAEDFGKLIGVSGQSVYNWEAEKTVPRRAQLQSLSRLRSVGKREVAKMLAGNEQQ